MRYEGERRQYNLSCKKQTKLCSIPQEGGSAHKPILTSSFTCPHMWTRIQIIIATSSAKIRKNYQVHLLP